MCQPADADTHRSLLFRPMNLNRDVRQAVDAVQECMVEGWTAPGDLADERNDRAEMTRTETPHMQIHQRVPCRFDCCAYFIAQTFARADVDQNGPGVANEAIRP